MLFTLCLLSVFLLPGYLASRLINVREYRFLTTITFSYFCFVMLAGVAARYQFSAHGLGYLLLGLCLILSLANIVVYGKSVFAEAGLVDKILSPTLNTITPLYLFLLATLYHVFFGIYDEVPADLYEHVRFVNRFYQKMEGVYPGKVVDLFSFRQPEQYWHQLIAWVSYITGTSLMRSYVFASLVSIFIYMTGFVLITDRIVRRFNLTTASHQFVVISALTLMFLQMGLNAFSYVRYYSFAPSMINFVIYFSGLLMAINLFENHDSKIRAVVVLGTAVITSYVIHQQEALFIVVYCGFLLFWFLIAKVFSCWRENRVTSIVFMLSVVLLLAACAAVYLYIKFEFTIPPFNHSKVIALPFTLPVIGKLYILNPEYQFIRVVTIWGALVYILFFLYSRRFIKQPVLILGMISPLFTVFNPVFTEVFLRIASSITLWRLCYLIPLHIVAALSLVFLYQSFLHGGWLKKIGSVAAIGGLGFLLLPSIASIPVNAYARTTLARVEEPNRMEHWKDMIETMQQTPSRSPVLTDPITGYLLRAFTSHKAYQKKFLPNWSYYNNSFVFDSYDDFPLSRYAGRLLLVNTRNGAPSLTGQRSHHWHRDVLRLTDYYPENLISHIQNNPDRFEKLWSAPKINLYRIQ